MNPTLSPLDRARQFNAALENFYLQLALELVDIQANQSWKGEYDSFEEFYQKDLGREKTTISRLLKAGNWLKDNGLALPDGQLSYKKLGYAISHVKGAPEHVLAAAQTLSYAEMLDEKAESEFGPDHEHAPEGAQRWAKCKCGKHIKV